MSTDVYFDFHSEGIWPFYLVAEYSKAETGDLPEGEWGFHSIWTKKLNELEGAHPNRAYRTHYSPERVGYVYNFQCNAFKIHQYTVSKETHTNQIHITDLYDNFESRYTNRLVGPNLIKRMLKDWQEIYDLAQSDPENGFKDDLLTTEEIKEVLNEHIGFFITFRTD